MKKRTLKLIFLLLDISFLSATLSAEIQFSDDEVGFNSWELIIYRPVNKGNMNEIRCWLKAEDPETGADVTYSKIKARYEWVEDSEIFHKNPLDKNWFFRPGHKFTLHDYRKTYYLSGGMAMHLTLEPGKYRFSVYTPQDQHFGVETGNRGTWKSNTFDYDTSNPAKVIFVCPTGTDNYFYNGGWWIDYMAPLYYIWTKPMPVEIK